MQNQIYGVILAGGQGTRMGNSDKPKQFLEVGGRPILIHTVEKFVVTPDFHQVIVLAPKQWLAYTKDIIKKYIKHHERIVVIEGGNTRNETIMNAIQYIENSGCLTENTIIVTHDSVRPFVTYRMIEENIRYAEECGACDTVIPASDTIVESRDGNFISNIPERKMMYQGQTPQSFKAKRLREIYESLTEKEREILTDACKIYVLKNEPVHLVEGDVSNIKITYPHDLRVAEAILGGSKTC
ncbi:2-C-methyl-D-erythritol 4-phosphate cytidylyltransferase [Mediterraneibacter glycyrrhizinilyticus]|uniref:IspD/TarI family cytidylyltransferase n=1 Tax=Mediterraneibacter glycyrrhizinilyticus TaxID=342942 RepID=UPI00265AD182|nr:2-C-methyl-D-erythritol 4-phosphate cytidylyltransferase [Mediterraneibacter glycyrrhizinilyticus]MCF2570145.1 2-C-methyl-D-erythritol 4-phosphate cytidylyltransferase [Mediterraneibacter glycyrrhizinilyticus]